MHGQEVFTDACGIKMTRVQRTHANAYFSYDSALHAGAGTGGQIGGGSGGSSSVAAKRARDSGARRGAWGRIEMRMRILYDR